MLCPPPCICSPIVQFICLPPFFLPFHILYLEMSTYTYTQHAVPPLFTKAPNNLLSLHFSLHNSFSSIFLLFKNKEEEQHQSFPASVNYTISHYSEFTILMYLGTLACSLLLPPPQLWTYHWVRRTKALGAGAPGVGGGWWRGGSRHCEAQIFGPPACSFLSMAPKWSPAWYGAGEQSTGERNEWRGWTSSTSNPSQQLLLPSLLFYKNRLSNGSNHWSFKLSYLWSLRVQS